MKNTKKSGSLIQIAVFLVFIFGMVIFNISTADKSFSPVENRMLAQRPVFSWDRLFSGEYMADYEEYITDQFAMRDGWTGLKAYSEKAIGKQENNGIYICGDTLIERFELQSQAQIDSNLKSIDKFIGNVDVPVYLMLIPTAAEIWQDKLPDGAPSVNQAAILESIPDRTQAQVVDVYSMLAAHRDEPIYYRTDHHWTSLGACYGADALLKAMGKEGVSPSDYQPQTVSTEFYGTLYSTSGARYVAPDSIEIYASDEGVSIASLENGGWVEKKLYDFGKLNEKDKYSMFMGGNQPLAVVKTGNEGEKLLLIRDSYADSEIPFLLGEFSEIHVIDLRYYKQNIPGYVQENGIDAVAVSYSLKNFAEDKNVYFLGMGGTKK